MARESGASLSVVPVQAIARITAPGGLDRAELALFESVVNSKPADWFGEDSAPLLVEYVRAQGMCDQLDIQVKAAIAASAGDDPTAALVAAKVIESFMRLRDMEAKRLLQIATKLRLTQQSRYTPQSAATANKGAKGLRPWHHGS